MLGSIYKRGKRIEQNIYWMIPSSERAQACNFFIQFQITYQLNTRPIALYTKEINWTFILHFPYALSTLTQISLTLAILSLIFYCKLWKASQRNVHGGFKVDYSVSPGTWPFSNNCGTYCGVFLKFQWCGKYSGKNLLNERLYMPRDFSPFS